MFVAKRQTSRSSWRNGRKYTCAMFSGGWIRRPTGASVIRGENYCVAGDRFQARIVFDACAAMIQDNPKLSSKFEVYKNSIIHKKTKGVLYVISAEAHGKHGFRPYSIAFDELHVQPNRELYDTLVKGLIKTPNSLCTMITTAGVQNTFAEEIHLTAEQIAKGLITNDSWYVAIYNADEKDDPFDERVIAKANPGYGTIIKEDDFKIVVDDAKAQATGVNSYKRLHLNIWTGATQAWIPVHKFDACNLAPVDLDYHRENHTPCYGGLDLASTSDLSSFAVIFDNGPDNPLDWACWFWCPAATVRERTKNENVNYEKWVEEGAIFTMPGESQDLEYIAKFVGEFYEQYNLKEVAYDPALSYKVVPEMEQKYGMPMFKFVQRLMQFAPPTSMMEKLVVDKMINHGGHEVLRWQMDNVQIWEDTNENKRPDKRNSRARIDGVVASLMALGIFMDQSIRQSDNVQIYFLNG